MLYWMVMFFLQDQLGLGGGAAGQQAPVQQQQPMAQQYNRSGHMHCVVQILAALV